MKISRIRLLGIVSLVASMTACQVDTPPALREAVAQGTAMDRTVAIPTTAAATEAATPEGTAAALHAQGRAGEHIDARSADASGPGAGVEAGTASRPAARSALADADDGPAAPEPSGQASASGADDAPVPGAPEAATASPPSRPASLRFPRPRAIRGLYANAWAAGSSARMDELIGIARRTEVNALVVDIKDASGYVSHRTKVPLAHEIGATGEIRIRDLPGLLDRLEREGIYPIARIVIVKDPILAEFRPELAVNDTAGGAWVDSKGFTWMNPYSRDVWDYHIALAREVAQLGFPEIQYDYVRFPDAPEQDLARAVYVGADGRSKPEVIGDFLRYAREELDDLDVRLTADVFGVTTSARRDVGIGQVWESFIDAVDAALPMVYPSHYWEGSFGFQVPNAHPYEIVRRALRDALERSAQVDGAGRTIPWLQDFSLGQPAYTSVEVRAQIQATYDAGIDEWILWNPGSRYTELALQPAEGFDREPYIRVANRVVPVSERWAVLDSVAVARADSLRTIRAERAAGDGGAAASGASGSSAAGDPGATSGSPGPSAGDPGATVSPDTLGVRRD